MDLRTQGGDPDPTIPPWRLRRNLHNLQKAKIHPTKNPITGAKT
jgi:hypothetical protein